MEKATEIRIVFVTTKSFEDAQQISRILVTEKLAACCSIIQNVASIFGWHGSISERHEYLIFIKTAESKVGKLGERITELHSDDVPEIISMTVDSAYGPYFSWLKQSLESNE